jgi:WD40 repeat protein
MPQSSRESGSLVSALAAHDEAVHGLAWLSPTLLLSGCEAGLLVAHDLRTQPHRPAWTLDLASTPAVQATGSSGGICCLQVVPISMSLLGAGTGMGAGAGTGGGSSFDLVLAGCIGGAVCILDCSRRAIIAAQKLHSDDVRGIVPIASTTATGTRGHEGANQGALRFITTSFDGTAAIWRAYSDKHMKNTPISFRRLALLEGHTDKVLGAAIVPRSQQVVTSGADGRVILWSAA